MKLALSLFLIVLPLTATAQTEDAEGCKDSAVLSRMPKCTISSCDKKDFDQASLQTGTQESGDPAMKSLEGAVETTDYECTEGVSRLAIVRNAENALKAAGFTTVYSGNDEKNDPMTTMRNGGLWVSVTTVANGDGTAFYKQTIVRTKEMEQQMTASAAEWESAINASGQCSIYGILFDTGKATIQPSSESCLNEVAKLLKNNPSWRMQIEGHTDNTGAKQTNLTLSQQRAEAVRSWLVGHGVEGARLVAKGMGDTKPVADNATEDGRAKNRRVALVKL